jgi:hypothetical protein
LEHATVRPGEKDILLVRQEAGPWLLGIDWAHLSIYEKIKEKDKITDTTQGYVVPSNSGQMAVVPAWKLHELLFDEKFISDREKSDLKIPEPLPEKKG